MDAKTRSQRLKILLDRQSLMNQKYNPSTLFIECIEALGDNTIIFSPDKTKEIYNNFTNEYEVTFYGRIEWTKYTYEEINIEAVTRLEVFSGIQDNDVYILWSHGDDPVIQTTIRNAFIHIEELASVTSDVWLYKPSKYVIEIFHDGIIRKVDKK